MRFCEFDKGCDNPVFGTDKKTGIGYCKTHQYLRTDTDKRSITQKAIAKHKEQKKKKPGWFDESGLNSEIVFVTPTPESFDGKRIDTRFIMDEVGVLPTISDNIEMDAFWKYAECVISKKPRCWECDEYISKSDYRNSTGHIFPKSLFPSVAGNVWNFVVVGNRCGCHNKTHTLATFSQMSIFPVAVQRYLKFGHLITEIHKYKDLFLDYANKLI